jgi:dimethylhistidine N-methyltransferase
MKAEVCGEIRLSDFEPTPDNFKAEFIAGLKRRPKILPCKLFYDEHGSRLFDQICQLDEYYLTRAETEILRNNITEIAALCGPRCVLVEPGSGSSSKTRLLLDHLERPVAYVPIDISRAHLLSAARALNGDYFPLEILPVCADYNRPLTLPTPARNPGRTVIFFPGSTIGNFEPWQAAIFLRRIASWCKPGDGLLIGVDLQKSRELLHLAYNDAKGITAAFNLNLLQRAILGHANYSGVPRDTPMAKALFAVDELAGFLVACALVRPSRSLDDLEVASVEKKLKDKAFARGVKKPRSNWREPWAEKRFRAALCAES